MCILILSEALLYSVLGIQLLFSHFSNLQCRKGLVDMTGTITVGCWHELKYNICFNCLYLAVFAFMVISFCGFSITSTKRFTSSSSSSYYYYYYCFIHSVIHSPFVSSPHTYFTLHLHYCQALLWHLIILNVTVHFL